jgi:HrpA-like RNA helicase
MSCRLLTRTLEYQRHHHDHHHNHDHHHDPLKSLKMASNHQESAFNTFGLAQPLPTFYTLKPVRERLPVALQKAQFEGLFIKNNILILSSGTGSGKTTQIPQYIAYLSRKHKISGKIACTQPRVLAATRVAERVSQEAGCALGTQVGYKVRGDDRTSEETRLMYIDSCRILTI